MTTTITDTFRLNNNICTLKGFSEKQVNVQIGVSMSNQYTRRSTQPASNPSRRIMPTTPTPSSHRRVKFVPSVDSNDSKTQRAVRDSIKDERNRQRNVAAANEARTRAIHNENEVKRATFATPTPRRSHAIVSGSQKSHTNPGKSDRQKAYDEARYREQKRMSEARTKDWQRKQKKVDEELSRKQRVRYAW